MSVLLTIGCVIWTAASIAANLAHDFSGGRECLVIALLCMIGARQETK